MVNQYGDKYMRIRVVSRYVDEDGCTIELCAVKGSDGRVRMRERFAKRRLNNRGISAWFGVLREKLKATFAKRMSLKSMEAELG